MKNKINEGTFKVSENEDVHYTESQGYKKDKKILERYKTIIDYYNENPGRVPDNGKMLSCIYYNDWVLRQDSELRDKLHLLLNSNLIKNQGVRE